MKNGRHSIGCLCHHLHLNINPGAGTGTGDGERIGGTDLFKP